MSQINAHNAPQPNHNLTYIMSNGVSKKSTAVLTQKSNPEPLVFQNIVMLFLQILIFSKC